MPDTIDMLELMEVLSYSLDSVATWFFCSVMAIFIFPAILDRIVFYIPKMIKLYRNDEVFFSGIVWSIVETVFWILVIATSYTCFYFFMRNLFMLTTVSPAAFAAWIICIVHLVYRIKNFDRIVKKNFYYAVYMRHIKPESLKQYQTFIDDLDTMELDDLSALLNKDLPYMHRQAVLRKQIELSSI